MNPRDFIYDAETYPNCFTLAAEHAWAPFKWSFEISEYRNDSAQLLEWLRWLKYSNARMVGFNNVGFDYPVLHTLIQTGKASAASLYDKAMAIIQGQDENRFAHMVYPSDRFVEQLDLYKIWHFDNKARATGLKALEFVMRMENLKDLPFPVGSRLNPEQIKILKEYNAHDVAATKRFYYESLEKIKLREDLSKRYDKDFLNHNDTKIGAEIFQIELEKAGIECYTYSTSGRQPKQTKRASIALAECMPMMGFKNPEFQRIYEWLSNQVITQTKGAFDDVKAVVGGIEYVFGTGGMHASVDNEYLVSNDEWMLYDIDVAGLYPSIAIAFGYYPEHLGPAFVEVYKKVVAERAKYKKGSAENAAFKLAGNGVYGKSNDVFSIFYDPKFTMKITMTGQMLIIWLAEKLLQVDGLRVIQCNTDGQTLYFKRSDFERVKQLCAEWEAATKLVLESVEYSKMIIRDVNNYLAVDLNGKVKMKGAYDWKKETGGQKDWHKDASALVIPKVAEKVLVEGAPIRQTVEQWPDLYDFMLRVKVNRGSQLVKVVNGGDVPCESTTRYYIAKGGDPLFKIMPPLAKKPGVWRRIGVESGWGVCTCNSMADAVLPVDYDYYVNEVEKLCLSVM